MLAGAVGALTGFTTGCSEGRSSASERESSKAIAGKGYAFPAPPTRRSYGPTGSRWPASTPKPEQAARTITVDCSWDAIAAAVNGLSANSVASGVHIKVRPGDLPGFGARSTSRAVMSGIGDATWSRNVLITPRDGFGSVTVCATSTAVGAARGVRLDGLSRLSLVGFDGPLAQVTLTATRHLRLARGRFLYLSPTVWHQDLHLTELVVGFGSSSRNPDSSDSFAARPLGSPPPDLARADSSILGLLIDGCHFRPAYRASGSTAHCDTLQFEVSSGKAGGRPIQGLMIRDTALFTSTGQGVIMSPETRDVVIDHVFAVGAAQTASFYPPPRGRESGASSARATPAATFNGFGASGRTKLIDSILVGSLLRTDGIGSIQNTVVTRPGTSARARGRWRIRPEIEAWGTDRLRKQIASVSGSRLRRIWT